MPKHNHIIRRGDEKVGEEMNNWPGVYNCCIWVTGNDAQCTVLSCICLKRSMI